MSSKTLPPDVARRGPEAWLPPDRFEALIANLHRAAELGREEGFAVVLPAQAVDDHHELIRHVHIKNREYLRRFGV